MVSDKNSQGGTGLTISTTLFQRISDHDAPAWNTFVQVYGPVVYGWCRKDGLSDDEAADVGQDVFRAVSGSIQRFERSATSNFLGWLRTITRFKVADYFRQASQTPRAVGGTAFMSVLSELSKPEGATPADVEPTDLDGTDAFIDPAETEESQRLITARTLELLKSRFSPQAWSAFWETAVNGRTAQDVGEDLDMSAMAVRKAKSRVLRRLKTELRELLPSFDG